MAVICAHVKTAAELLPGDVINIHGAGSIIEHVSVTDSQVSAIAAEGGRVFRFEPEHQLEYVTNQEWSRI